MHECKRVLNGETAETGPCRAANAEVVNIVTLGNEAAAEALADRGGAAEPAASSSAFRPALPVETLAGTEIDDVGTDEAEETDQGDDDEGKETPEERKTPEQEEAEGVGMCLGQEVDAKIECRDEEGEEGRGVVVLPVPQKVTKAQRDEHNLTHMPYRSWCPYCVRARGRNQQHGKAKKGHECEN